MKLSVRLFLGYFLLVAVTGQLVLLLVVKQISPGVRMALEASLVDTANLLAELAAPELAGGRLPTANSPTRCGATASGRCRRPYSAFRNKVSIIGCTSPTPPASSASIRPAARSAKITRAGTTFI